MDEGSRGATPDGTGGRTAGPSAAPPPETALSTASVRGLYVVAAVTMGGVSTVFALLAELQDRYRLETRSLGWIAGAAFAAALVTQLSLSRYADRGHARLILRVGVLASGCGLLWFAVATELWQFVAARALLGAGVGMLVPPARRAILLASNGNPGELLGTFYAAYLAGFVFGPPIGGVLTELGDVRLPFAVFGVAVLVMLVPIARMEMTEARGEELAAAVADRRVLRRLITTRRVLAAALVVVSFRYSIGVFEPLWATHLDRLGASTMVVTLSLTGFALPMLLVARRAGALSDRYGPRFTSVISALATVPLMASYGVLTSVPLIVLLVIPHGLLEAVQSPGTQAALAEAAPKRDAASAQGLGEAAGSAAAAIGAFTSAPLYDWAGAGTAWAVAGLIMFGLLSTSALLERPRRRVALAEDAALPSRPDLPSVASGPVNAAAIEP
ncbi:MAG: MFS transporter [Acidimicrobiales bacterium]